MTKLQRIIIFLLALTVIGLLMFFAFTIFIAAIIIAPIAYLYSKLKTKENQSNMSEKPSEAGVIDAEYEVIKDEQDSIK